METDSESKNVCFQSLSVVPPPLSDRKWVQYNTHIHTEGSFTFFPVFSMECVCVCVHMCQCQQTDLVGFSSVLWGSSVTSGVSVSWVKVFSRSIWIGFKIRRWRWDKSSELLFPGIHFYMLNNSGNKSKGTCWVRVRWLTWPVLNLPVFHWSSEQRSHLHLLIINPKVVSEQQQQRNWPCFSNSSGASSRGQHLLMYGNRQGLVSKRHQTPVCS